MKKLILFLSVVFMTMSSFNTVDSAEIVLIDCNLYAADQAVVIEGLGGNYYQAYFQAFSFCLGNL